MAQLDSEDLWEKTRIIFIDLFKYVVSVSLGITGTLALIIMKDGKGLSSCQKSYYLIGLYAMLLASVFAIAAWVCIGMYYSARAFYFNDQDKKKRKWSILRNIFIGVFVICFVLGIVAVALFIYSFL